MKTDTMEQKQAQHDAELRLIELRALYNAAPALLAALRAVLPYAEAQSMSLENPAKSIETLAAARAAIAAATGTGGAE